jgi:O-methyltransferase involved in polyketide biosynthesis
VVKLVFQQHRPVDERRYLRANHWLDQQCLAFFNQYPKGLGIECGAGLSTRFHRLSEQHEWPQFSWADIDCKETISLKSAAMPVIDNYRLIANDRTIEELIACIQWNGTTPLLIVIDGLSRHVDVQWVKALLSVLLVERGDRASIGVSLVIKKTSRWYEKLIGRMGIPVLGHWQLLASDLSGDIIHVKRFGKSAHIGQEEVMGLSLRF